MATQLYKNKDSIYPKVTCENSLISTATDVPLAANQGRILKNLIDDINAGSGTTPITEKEIFFVPVDSYNNGVYNYTDITFNDIKQAIADAKILVLYKTDTHNYAIINNITVVSSESIIAEAYTFQQLCRIGFTTNTITLNPTKVASTVINNLTSTSITDALSAAQGKILNDKINNIHIIDEFDRAAYIVSTIFKNEEFNDSLDAIYDTDENFLADINRAIGDKKLLALEHSNGISIPTNFIENSNNNYTLYYVVENSFTQKTYYIKIDVDSSETHLQCYATVDYSGNVLVFPIESMSTGVNYQYKTVSRSKLLTAIQDNKTIVVTYNGLQYITVFINPTTPSLYIQNINDGSQYKIDCTSIGYVIYKNNILIDNNSITTEKIANKAITSAKLADKCIKYEHLSQHAVSNLDNRYTKAPVNLSFNASTNELAYNETGETVTYDMIFSMVEENEHVVLSIHGNGYMTNVYPTIAYSEDYIIAYVDFRVGNTIYYIKVTNSGNTVVTENIAINNWPE